MEPPAAPPPRRPGPPTLPRGPPARPAQGRCAHPPPSSAASSSPGSPMSGGGEGPAAAAAAGWKVPAGLQPGSRTRRPPAAPPHAPSRWHFLSRAGNPRGPPARALARPPPPPARASPPSPSAGARPRPLLGTLGPALAAGLSNDGARPGTSGPGPSARARVRLRAPPASRSFRVKKPVRQS